MVRARPTTSGPETVVRRSTTDSVAMPRSWRAASSCAALRSAGSATYSRSHETPTRTSVHLHAECPAEPDVALDHLAHVAQPVAEHESALDTHTEGEARVDLRV